MSNNTKENQKEIEKGYSTVRFGETPYMSETHPLNPYGINYIKHPIENKVFFKVLLLF